jgi:hypothetical protein
MKSKLHGEVRDLNNDSTAWCLTTANFYTNYFFLPTFIRHMQFQQNYKFEAKCLVVYYGKFNQLSILLYRD